jgi:hypothetical protein
VAALTYPFRRNFTIAASLEPRPTFGGGLRDEVALVPRGVELQLGWLALPLRASDGCRPVGRSPDNFVESHLAGVANRAGPTMTMPKCTRLAMIENSVVSFPPCWVALEVKAAELSVQGATHPQRACLFPEAAHRQRHATETSGHAYCNRAIFRPWRSAAPGRV